MCRYYVVQHPKCGHVYSYEVLEHCHHGFRNVHDQAGDGRECLGEKENHKRPLCSFCFNEELRQRRRNHEVAKLWLIEQRIPMNWSDGYYEAEKKRLQEVADRQQAEWEEEFGHCDD